MADCHRDERPSVSRMRGRWLEIGVPAAEIDRTEEFDLRWGGLALPPLPMDLYEGGPLCLKADLPEQDDRGEWYFGAGDAATACDMCFEISPTDEFGIRRGDRFHPVHASVAGWIEAVALSYFAAAAATRITQLTGAEVDQVSLDGHTPIRETAGIADTWWRRGDQLVALYDGESRCFNIPEWRTAIIYDGVPSVAPILAR
ncbi:hypothetical protein [Nocardia alni]|uniref:hypothetical protein n=1 Tax=Nocardia alni TaxID=2815723 RepID=UPI001C24942A|nr:hypothetical protein [Nocardia alni]